MKGAIVFMLYSAGGMGWDTSVLGLRTAHCESILVFFFLSERKMRVSGDGCYLYVSIQLCCLFWQNFNILIIWAL